MQPHEIVQLYPREAAAKLQLLEEEIQRIRQSIDDVRREERARAVGIIKDWEIYSPYIVGKMRIETRKEAIIAAIWGDYEQDYYSGA